ncbi:hypothetical protein B0H65DRAFT_550470 [Neurospora tetraspora]|uniref:Uncharacterized protein n=1 Tax=Neurospora tetraspora TaxID=94610 RepID=A0AAE0JE27_9PEZI|nr:hypothetical protein B0H65DRAFT_550470 [Neurospora tetraspora]
MHDAFTKLPTELEPKTTTISSTKHLRFSQIFSSNSPHAHSDVRLVEQVAWDGVETEKEARAKRLGNKEVKWKVLNEGEKVADIGKRNRGPPPLSDRPGRWGQALAELGATICLPAPENSTCELCPIQGTCRAYAEGLEIAREQGLVLGHKQSDKEKGRQTLNGKVEELHKRQLVDIEDAACTLCPSPPPLPFLPPPPPSHPPHRPSDAPANRIKVETQDEADPDVQYLCTLPMTPLPSTEENIQHTRNIQNIQTTTKNVQTTRNTQMNRDENTISVTFYEQNSCLKAHVDDPNLNKPKPSNLLDPTAKEFITTYCAQYPYTKPKAQKQSK